MEKSNDIDRSTADGNELEKWLCDFPQFNSCPIDDLNEYCEKFSEEIKEGVYWLQKAAEQGLAKAQYRLGKCYKRGIGFPQNYKKAVEWFKKAADEGESRGIYCLGQCYEKGFDVAQSWEKAIEYYTKASDNDNPDATFRLGELYEYGEGVPKNEDESRKWYHKAEILGHHSATDKLYGDEYWGDCDVQDCRYGDIKSYSFSKSLWEK